MNANPYHLVDRYVYLDENLKWPIPQMPGRVIDSLRMRRLDLVALYTPGRCVIGGEECFVQRFGLDQKFIR